MKRMYGPPGSPAAKRFKPYVRKTKKTYPVAKAGIMNMSKFVTTGKAEQKFLDNSFATPFPASVTTAGNLILINGCVQGTSMTTRIGNRITLKSIRIIFGSAYTAVNLTGNQVLRVKVVYDKESNGAAPTAAQILAADAWNYPNNLFFAGRFLTLYDKTYTPNNQGQANTADFNDDIYVKMNLPVVFNSGNAGTVADISSGSIYLLLYTGGFTYTAESGSMVTRVRFEDA